MMETALNVCVNESDIIFSPFLMCDYLDYGQKKNKILSAQPIAKDF